ncbi:hypothetical protein A9Q84_10555 [Halobacteriovorax marinus]|uniref:HTTM domain-containing protein n=1 Tax=Halobacteriovorax marinus TaxID=97084 RepID=A0A1Y5F7B6_9BACT|nr:hypothetical protein A9Q84_10555 [Halobacteriovorax marinus]
MPSHSKTLEYLLRIAAFSVLFGRGLQHIIYDVPYRVLVWDESLWQGLFQTMDWNWSSFVTSPTVDKAIVTTGAVVGIFLILTSLVAAFNYKKAKLALVLSSSYLVFISILYTADKFFIPAQFIEYSTQMFTPFFLVLFWKFGEKQRLVFWMRVAVALTFIGHGSYALGIYPTPGPFIDMVIAIMNCDEPTAIVFLKIMGSLDFVAAILLFIPYADKWALGFCCTWGALTTMARISEGNVFGITHTLVSLGHEFIIRLPHFFIPLFLLVSVQKKTFNFLKVFYLKYKF